MCYSWVDNPETGDAAVEEFKVKKVHRASSGATVGALIMSGNWNMYFSPFKVSIGPNSYLCVFQGVSYGGLDIYNNPITYI